MYAVFETVIVAVIVAFSAVQLLRTLFPKSARAVLGRIGFRPASKTTLDGGCGSGSCNACKGCSSFSFDPAAEPVPPVAKR